jgi:hypothetical protein
VKTHDRSETFVLQGNIVIIHQSLLNSIFTTKLYILMKKIYIFFIAFPFHHIGLSGTLRSTNVFHFSFGGAAGLLPPTPTLCHPLLSSPLSGRYETHTTQHPWEAHPAWDSNPADLAVVSEECRSSFHHATVSP